MPGIISTNSQNAMYDARDKYIFMLDIKLGIIDFILLTIY